MFSFGGELLETVVQRTRANVSKINQYRINTNKKYHRREDVITIEPDWSVILAREEKADKMEAAGFPPTRSRASRRIGARVISTKRRDTTMYRSRKKRNYSLIRCANGWINSLFIFQRSPTIRRGIIRNQVAGSRVKKKQPERND